MFYWFEDWLKSWAKHELRRQEITELTVVMAEAESFVELGPTKNKFKCLSLMERAMVRETMRKMKRDIAMMATILIAQVAIENHKMRSGDLTTQGTRERG
ncbi:hypothetical protein Gohar_026725 [Gossypium harknessii]|uniref:Uncharacterized protein n=1 Tax=Gossypium harknessii TaxID=34285 RepID=A0A7J9HSF6_9ROSI|nr:hypothetical protein [Gossypium harknessii]